MVTGQRSASLIAMRVMTVATMGVLQMSSGTNVYDQTEMLECQEVERCATHLRKL